MKEHIKVFIVKVSGINLISIIVFFRGFIFMEKKYEKNYFIWMEMF